MFRVDSVQGNRAANIEIPAETDSEKEMRCRRQMNAAFEFATGFILIVLFMLFILVSVAVIVDGYLENKEKYARKQRREKWRKEKTAKNMTT